MFSSNTLRFFNKLLVFIRHKSKEESPSTEKVCFTKEISPLFKLYQNALQSIYEEYWQSRSDKEDLFLFIHNDHNFIGANVA